MATETTKNTKAGVHMKKALTKKNELKVNDSTDPKTADAPKGASAAQGTKHRRRMMMLAILALIALFAVFLLRGMEKSDTGEVGGAKLMNVATYHGRDVANDDRQPQEEFAYGDQILVGFDYEGEIDEKKALVTVVVYDEESDEEVFRTNKFRLLNSNDSLQVNINNMNLAAGEYRVELQDEEGMKVVDAEYTITE